MLAGDNGGCDRCDCFLVMEQTVGEKQQSTNGSTLYGSASSIRRCRDGANLSEICCNVRVAVSAGDNGACDCCVCFAVTEITVGEKQQYTDGSSQYRNTKSIERHSDDRDLTGIH